MRFNLENNLNKDNIIEAVVCHDNCGNIYLKYNSIYLLLDVNNDDDIEIIRTYNINKLIQENNCIKFKELKNSDNKTSLKGKAVNEFEKKLEDEKNEEVMRENNDNENYYKFYPDSKNYYHDDDDSENSDEEDEEFKFYTTGDIGILETINVNKEWCSSYDTIVMEKNSNFTHMLMECSVPNSYVVILYTNGEIDLNIVGSKRKLYKLSYVEDEEDEIKILCKCEKVLVIT